METISLYIDTGEKGRWRGRKKQAIKSKSKNPLAMGNFYFIAI